MSFNDGFQISTQKYLMHEIHTQFFELKCKLIQCVFLDCTKEILINPNTFFDCLFLQIDELIG